MPREQTLPLAELNKQFVNTSTNAANQNAPISPSTLKPGSAGAEAEAALPSACDGRPSQAKPQVNPAPQRVGTAEQAPVPTAVPDAAGAHHMVAGDGARPAWSSTLLEDPHWHRPQEPGRTITAQEQLMRLRQRLAGCKTGQTPSAACDGNVDVVAAAASDGTVPPEVAAVAAMAAAEEEEEAEAETVGDQDFSKLMAAAAATAAATATN